MENQTELHKKYSTLFHTTQCSWCRKFYPTLHSKCPFDELRSSCISYEKVIEVIGWWTREAAVNQYEQRVVDMMQHVEQHGIMTKCRKCGALNPNPQEDTCWNCNKEYFHCPVHKSLILRYNIKGNFWKCPDASHGQKYHEIP